MEKFTVSELAVTPVRVNVYTRSDPPSATDDGDTATVTTVSSLTIVPVAELGLPTLYPVPEVTVRTTVSSASGVESAVGDRKSTRLNSSHGSISYAVFCLKKKNTI